MNLNDFISKLNISLTQQQLAVVQAVDGPTLILAVPGSGKTTVITTGLGYMIYCVGILPESILTITYTTESDVHQVRSLITFAKNMMLADAEIEELGNDNGIKLLDIYRRYNNALRTNSWIDYDDQMVYARKILQLSPGTLQYF